MLFRSSDTFGTRVGETVRILYGGSVSSKNAVDYMFDGLERRSPQHFAVRQYKKYKLASGDICSK